MLQVGLRIVRGSNPSHWRDKPAATSAASLSFCNPYENRTRIITVKGCVPTISNERAMSGFFNSTQKPNLKTDRSDRRILKSQPPSWQPGALPLSYYRLYLFALCTLFKALHPSRRHLRYLYADIEGCLILSLLMFFGALPFSTQSILLS